MGISAEQIKALRDKTGVSMMMVRKALEEAEGDETRALEVLSQLSAEVAGKKSDRELGAGVIDAYIHHDKKSGVLLDVRCESDFVSKNEEFQSVIHRIALQIVAMKHETVEELLAAPSMQDENKTVQDVINELTGKFGERVTVTAFTRYTIA